MGIDEDGGSASAKLEATTARTGAQGGACHAVPKPILVVPILAATRSGKDACSRRRGPGDELGVMADRSVAMGAQFTKHQPKTVLELLHFESN
ncbi:hypothetical protein E2562_002609 [Oryza meyeriana var. granulata]|uniref:Uncharacterized protein n=1 Tax=Oryza meyeriana var. granulata TaxID=110450 RepID=A0A6G1F304_9ORYZ|nr:hypothetical protein E2562_002609 [Oryza meyeriana var. granulata]